MTRTYIKASVSKRWIIKKMSKVFYETWKIQEHFKNKSLKTYYFKGFSRTTYNSRTIQGIQEALATLLFLSCQNEAVRI